MVEYLENFPPFGVGNHPTEDKILELVDLSLLKECPKELIIQGFDSVTQGLTKLVKFCERPETSE